MNTERIKKISGGLLILLGICSLTFLPGMGFSTGTISIDSFIPMAYIITGVCLFLNRSETFMIRSMAVLEALWVLPSLWLSLRLLQAPAQSIVTGIPGFFSKILWLYYLIHAFRFGVLALLGFYVPYAKKGALVGMIVYGVLAVSKVFSPRAFVLYLGYALLFRRLRQQEPAQNMPHAGNHPNGQGDVIETHGEVVQDHPKG